jgi:hypothetical protein
MGDLANLEVDTAAHRTAVVSWYVANYLLVKQFEECATQLKFVRELFKKERWKQVRVQ